MLVWGGADRAIPAPAALADIGGLYDLASSRWVALPLERAPEPRRDHSAVWSGTEMIVWGGVAEPLEYDMVMYYSPGEPELWWAVLIRR